MKLQAPSFKLQRISKSQIPEVFNPQVFDVWILGFLWCLELGAWSFQSL